MRRKVKIVCFLLVFLALTMAGCRTKTEEEINLEQVETQENSKSTGSTKEAECMYVDVCGQVRHPGVYELPKESRVFQAIESAGGFTEKAAVSTINQAQKLEDGQQLYVPSKKEVQVMEDASGQNPKEISDGKVNLNTASREELMTLTGIGEVKADSIIRYRETKGGFHSVEELKEVEGIKDGVFQKVKDQIKI